MSPRGDSLDGWAGLLMVSGWILVALPTEGLGEDWTAGLERRVGEGARRAVWERPAAVWLLLEVVLLVDGFLGCLAGCACPRGWA